MVKENYKGGKLINIDIMQPKEEAILPEETNVENNESNN
jgi:hypothetical protein